MTAIPIEVIEKLTSVKKMNPIKKRFVLSRENRLTLYKDYTICKLKGYNTFVEVCNPSTSNKEVIKDLLATDYNLN